MKRSRTSPFFTFILGLAVLLGAGAVRFWYLQTAATVAADAGWRVQNTPRTTDEAGKNDHDVLLENLKNYGLVHGFRSHAPLGKQEEETAHLAPGYVAFRYGLEEFIATRVGFGENPAEFTKWAQVALGSLTAWLVFLIAARAFGSLVVALLAGLGAVAHPYWIISVATLEDGTLATFLVTLSLYLAVRGGQQGGALTALLLGLALSAAALTRATLLPFAFVILLWYLWRSRYQNNGWLFALVAFFGFACGIASWSVRCYQQLGEPVPLVSTAWWHLWVGNNPAATGGPLTGEMLEKLSAERRNALAELSQSKRYVSLAEDVKEEVLARPYAAMARRAKAMIYFFLGTTEFKQAKLMEPGGSSTVPDNGLLQILGGTLFGVFLLAALGWRWSYGWKWSTAPLALAVIWIPLPYVLAHAETLHGPRLPLDGVFIILAAFALACFIPGIGGRLFRGENAAVARTGA